jgi:ATP-dependent helicase HrpB
VREPLPIDEALPQILSSLRSGPALVLEAPPGAGKTTRVPPALLALVPGEIVVLEPRRLAARTAARRVAQELGERPGETVGYQVRFDEVSSARTRLRYVTEGILTRRLLGDPDLRGVSAVVLDEFHERHLQGDLALALLLRLLRKRSDLKLVVMSATLDTAPLAQFLRAPIVRSEGRRFPVAIEHLEKPDERRLGDQVAAAVRKLTAPGAPDGDVLVFLPGAAEIRHAQQACEEIARHRGLLLTPLHGDLGPDEQDRAIARGARRKVILATNVAETSVTIEGVTAVVDSGLARVASHSQWSGLSTLRVANISRASAVQRAGRAGRTAPGRALRLYTKLDFEQRADHHPPEILRADLAATVLELRAAGIDPAALPWLDEPPPAALGAAGTLLRRLGAIDGAGRITAIGTACARLPVHPRLARLLVEAAARGCPREGAVIAASLSEGEIRLAPTTGSSDLLDLPDPGRAREQLERALQRTGASTSAQQNSAGAHRPGANEPARLSHDQRDEALRIAVLTGFPDRVARRRSPGSDEILLAGGGTAQLSSSSSVRAAPLLIAVDAEERGAQGRGRVLVRLASAIEPEWLLDLYAGSLREETELVWEPSRERVEKVSRLLYDALVLEESRGAPEPFDPRAAALLLAHASFDEEPVAQLKIRSALVAQHCPEAGLRALTGEDVKEAQRALCMGRSSVAELRAADLSQALLDRLGPAAPRALATLAPEHVALPGGRKLRVEYIEGQPPAARSRLQDFFGLARGPAVANGRVPLVLHLLAPNGRAQQVTQDLAGFWQRHYPAVRRELMRKYPRHPWPEDGATATPPAPRR